MYYKIEVMEGVGRTYADKLARAGIATTEDLLDLCDDRDGCDAVAEASGLSHELILRWAHLADLMRINGIGPQYSELLEAAGVDTVLELRRRDAGLLAADLDVVNARRRLTRVTPARAVVEKWVALARTTEPRIRH